MLPFESFNGICRIFGATFSIRQKLYWVCQLSNTDFANQNNNIMNKIFVTCRLGPDPKKSDPELITISWSSGRWFIFNGKFNFVSMIRWTR